MCRRLQLTASDSLPRNVTRVQIVFHVSTTVRSCVQLAAVVVEPRRDLEHLSNIIYFTDYLSNRELADRGPFLPDRLPSDRYYTAAESLNSIFSPLPNRRVLVRSWLKVNS